MDNILYLNDFRKSKESPKEILERIIVLQQEFYQHQINGTAPVYTKVEEYQLLSQKLNNLANSLDANSSELDDLIIELSRNLKRSGIL